MIAGIAEIRAHSRRALIPPPLKLSDSRSDQDNSAEVRDQTDRPNDRAYRRAKIIDLESAFEPAPKNEGRS